MYCDAVANAMMMQPAKEAEEAEQFAKDADDEARACEIDVDDAKAVLTNAESRASDARKRATALKNAAEHAIQKVSQVNQDATSLKQRVATAWQKKWNETHEQYYYYNTVTLSTTWYEPDGFQVNTQRKSCHTRMQTHFSQILG